MPKKQETLPAATLAKLQKLDSDLELDSPDALEIDEALLEIVSDGLPDDYDLLEDAIPSRAAFWAAWALELEVNNGGFDQFFLNKGPVPAAVALRFYTQHGPADVADLLGRAIKALPGGVLPANYDDMTELLTPDDQRERERLSNVLNELDDNFFERDGVSLSEVRLKFVLAHSTDFFKVV